VKRRTSANNKWIAERPAMVISPSMSQHMNRMLKQPKAAPGQAMGSVRKPAA
jgi:hypothetical protein